MCGYDDANVHADPASLVLSGSVRGPGQVDRFQLGEEIEIFCSFEKRHTACDRERKARWLCRFW